MKKYIDQLDNKNLKILIPGAGNAYEAEYLWNNGFYNTFLVDISEKAIENFLDRVPDFPEAQAINSDFFDLDDSFDLILEQTFFCALPKSFRKNYVSKLFTLLKKSGHLAGLLFNIPLNEDHPPFGGQKSEYQDLFAQHFEILIMETAYNSVDPRQGNELFIKFRKK